ncbi:uncharacterized protein LOC130450794 [Diorhabda sublineata]|uniref:uncharacterized protein LOC130450794 n=1 Tax=Diorhabda sublineata TaxID=1163346 RepID=UPI0024E16796|nr:uncharacterized protein LOC130450794 [Diorhabda sublineata]
MVIYVLYFLFIASICSVYQILCVNLNEYLDQQSKFLEEQFLQTRRTFNKRDSSNIAIENFEENITGIHDYIRMYSYLNSTYVLTKQDLYEISSKKLLLVPQNQTFDKIRDSEKITFMKDIVFDNFSFIIIKSEIMGEAYVYISNRTTKFSLIQNLFIPDATDAHFFINNRNLFLIVANNKGDNLAVTSIYKWLGFHFDEIQTVFTTGAIKLGSFTTRTAEIIIILQDLSDRTVPSFVYQFINEKITKLQHLRTINPIQLDIYGNTNESYVIIYSKSKINTVYRWNDLEYTPVSRFKTENDVQMSKVVKVNKTYLIIIPTKENIQIYSLNFGEIKLEVQRPYPSNFSEILDIHKGMSKSIYVVGLNNNLEVKIDSFYIFPINSESQKTDISKSEEHIRECFKNFELMVVTKNDNLKENSEHVLLENLYKNDTIQAESLSKDEVQNLDTAIKQLQVQLSHLKLLADPENLVIDEDTTIKGQVYAKNLKAKNIILNLVNKEKWAPGQWLKYDEPQVITGKAKFKTLVTDHLDTNDETFKDLLLKNGSQVFTESLKIKNLTAYAMFAANINNVTIEDVYLKSSPVKIRGVKLFKTLNVEEARLASLNEEAPDLILSAIVKSTETSSIDFNANNIEINHLIVDTINNVSWNEFKNSVFRINETTEITGSLNFTTLRTAKLRTNKLKNIDVNKIFTTSTDQNITAHVEIHKILVENITADRINNIKFDENNLLLINKSDLNTGAVTFNRVIVRNDLNVTGQLNNSLFMKNGDHVFGTKESDLSQTYIGKVVINNDLYLEELNVLHTTKLIVSDTEVNPNFTKVYWSKSREQEIPVPVNFTNGLSIPHLTVETLNDIKIDNFLLNDNKTKKKTDFAFESVTVLGNVTLQNDTQHTPNLKKISEEYFKKIGSLRIQGKKVFVGTLKIDNLEVSELEGINVSQTLNSKQPKNITATKIFEHLIVENSAKSDFENVNTINAVPLHTIGEKFIFIDEPNNINMLNFEHIKVNNLYVLNINGRPLEDYYSLNKAIDNTSVLQNLTIEGNISIGHLLNMSSLQNIPCDELSKNALHKGEYGIKGDVKFTRNIMVNNLVTSFVNDINLKSLITRILIRNTNQNITATYNFTNIKTENLVTPKINNVDVQNLIDIYTTSPQKIILPNGSLFSDVVFKSIKASKISPCSIEAIKNELTDPQTKEWAEIEIKGDVTLLDGESLLYKIFEKSVRISTRNVIHAPVNFTSNVMVKNLNSVKLINGINIAELLEDAVLSESDKPQIINGIKWFLTLHTKNAFILDNLETTYLNDEKIVEINEIIVDKDSKNKTIRGLKTFFGGVQTNKFNSDHISKISTESLVNLDKLKPIPEAICERLEVNNNLNITFYGNINFTDVIINRLRTDGEEQIANGIYYFQNLEVQNLSTPSINDINMGEVVFDEGTQDIFGTKHFFQHVEIMGNASIDLINGVNLTDRFDKTISNEVPVNITGSVTILKPTRGYGTIKTESINGHSVSEIKNVLASNDKHIETDEIFKIKTVLIEKIKNSLRMVERLPEELMYLEISKILQITVPNVVGASSVTTNENVLIHVNGYETGIYCGLPNTCTCPSQYSIEISSQFSVNIFPNKGFQRIFTYDDEKSVVNILTNSISTSSICRSNKSKLMNEVSMVTWTKKTERNIPGVFYQYDKFLSGYISKVDFFSLNGKSYAVIGRYYDPVVDSYNLDCTVMRFDENRLTATDIQRIPTKGVQELYVFHTAQGVLLVIGNQIPTDIYHEYDDTKIYRFNPGTEKFTELRTIPSFGSSMVTGIVVGADSLIALAHNEAPVQVLKYYPEFDNYYFYQSFPLEDQVIAVSSFYTGGFGISDAYLCIVTSNEQYYIYSYQFIEGFKLKLNGQLEGLKNLIPIQIKTQTYLFAPSAKNSSLLTVVKNGSS